LILNAGGWAGDHKADVELFDWKTGQVDINFILENNELKL